MGQIRQSLAWWCFQNGPLEPAQFLRAVAEMGYAGIELIEPEHFPMVRDCGLTITAHRGHESIESGFNRRENHARIEAEIVANLKLAEEWGIPNLICFSGNRAGQSDAEGRDLTIEGFRRVAKFAEDSGVNLVLELLNSRVDHPDYQCDNSAWGVEVVRGVGSPRVSLLYDIYHAQVMEGDIIRHIRENHSFIGHYHTAGNPGRGELDAGQEINYPPVISAIRATGYQGFITHEFVPTREPLEGLKEAFELCESAWNNS